jgi:hypothetical protein
MNYRLIRTYVGFRKYWSIVQFIPNSRDWYLIIESFAGKNEARQAFAKLIGELISLNDTVTSVTIEEITS